MHLAEMPRRGRMPPLDGIESIEDGEPVIEAVSGFRDGARI
jgi:hypothetical protein